MEFVDEDGVIHEDVSPEAIESFATAKRELAAFKFRVMETVAADRRLRAAPCTEVMIVYLRFLTIDPRTLKPKPVYASTTKLAAYGGIKTKPTARRGRSLLVKHGYLKPNGSQTKCGCIWFSVENPHHEQVMMSAREAEERYAQIEAEEKKAAREKKQNQNIGGGSITNPPEMARGVDYLSDRGSIIDPNYLGGNRGRYSSEGQDTFAASSYGELPEPEADDPYPVPETEDELASALADFRDHGFSPAVIGYFRIELMAGRLTPAMVEQQRSLAA